MLTVFSMGSFAQINRTLDTKVADVLAQMPTKNLEEKATCHGIGLSILLSLVVLG